MRLIAGTNGGGVFVSGDGGATWTEISLPNAEWSVASSSDGRKLVAGGQGIYVSNDGGAVWTRTQAPLSAAVVACSADGMQIVAGAGGVGGKLFVNGLPPSLVAEASSVLDLIYAGSGVFFVNNVSGTVYAP